MNIIFLSSSDGILCSIGLCKIRHYLALLLLIALLGSVFAYGGYWLAREQSGPDLPDEVGKWRQALHEQRKELEQLKQESQATIEALSSRLGLLQAHVNRIDALGQKLVKMAKIDKGEFDFSHMPAVGGPESLYQDRDLSESELRAAIDRLASSLEDRENQLTVLENLLMNRNLQAEVQPRGRPIVTGWLSSYYGMRTHPISGKREMHKGIDFASKLGAPVVAVAKGVVTFAGEKSGYGKVIDINHGNGYTTRYAHNSKLLVSVGDTVEKGFQIAEVGTSGRSTGPHVHFEVLRRGRQINPMKFIRAAR